MKLLPKKVDIDKIKAQERKLEIDNGLALAKQIDALRDTRVSEERQLREWRDNSLKTINYEISQKVKELNNLNLRCYEARELRKELIKPLDNEWEKVNLAKSEIVKEKDLIDKEKEIIIKSKENIKNDIDKLNKVVSKIKIKEEEIKKTSENILNLQKNAQYEYDKAKSERIDQRNKHEKALLHVKHIEEEYLNGIEINKAFKQQLEEKESELITRENYITTQQKALLIAKGELEKQNA